jgi:sigma-70-like protein
VTPEELAEVWLDRQRELHGIARRYSAGDEAEDIVQEVYIRTLVNIDKISPDTVRVWMCAICRNLAIDKVRRLRHIERQREGGEEEEPIEGLADWRTEWEMRKIDDADLVWKIIEHAGMGEDVKMVIDRELQGGRQRGVNIYAALSLATGLTTPALKSRWRLGMNRLRWSAVKLGVMSVQRAAELGVRPAGKRWTERRWVGADGGVA